MVETLKDIKIILFTVLATNQYVLITDLVHHVKYTFGEDGTDKFLIDMIRDSGYCFEILKKYNKPLVMNEKDHAAF